MRMPSIVYKINDEDFAAAVQSATSIRQALISLKLNGTGSAYRVFKKRAKSLKLDTSHFVGKAHLKGKNNTWAIKTPLQDILVKDSLYTNNNHLKNRILKEGFLKNECSECNLLSVWNDKPIVLQLDHINGIHNDNRLENLRILCPNCHSQTTTFAGKNMVA